MSPYGMPKDMGGDNKQSEKFMTDCISAVSKKNPKYSKDKVIAICKSTYMKSKGDSKMASFILDQLYNKE